MSIQQYQVCETSGANGLKKIEELVNSLIAEGWQPIGGIYVVWSALAGNWWYYQAMVKTAKPFPSSAAP